MAKKTLYRSEDNKILCGVCGGIAEYANTDPTIIRLVVILLALLTGGAPVLVAYLLACLIMPNPPTRKTVKRSRKVSKRKTSKKSSKRKKR